MKSYRLHRITYSHKIGIVAWEVLELKDAPDQQDFLRMKGSKSYHLHRHFWARVDCSKYVLKRESLYSQDTWDNAHHWTSKRSSWVQHHTPGFRPCQRLLVGVQESWDPWPKRSGSQKPWPGMKDGTPFGWNKPWISVATRWSGSPLAARCDAVWLEKSWIESI